MTKTFVEKFEKQTADLLKNFGLDRWDENVAAAFDAQEEDPFVTDRLLDEEERRDTLFQTKVSSIIGGANGQAHKTIGVTVSLLMQTSDQFVSDLSISYVIPRVAGIRDIILKQTQNNLQTERKGHYVQAKRDGYFSEYVYDNCKHQIISNENCLYNKGKLTSPSAILRSFYALSSVLSQETENLGLSRLSFDLMSYLKYNEKMRGY